MYERQKLRADLRRYRILLQHITDQRAVAVIEKLIKETEDRLSQIENGQIQHAAEIERRGAERLRCLLASETTGADVRRGSIRAPGARRR
jgi:hypothetical protein